MRSHIRTRIFGRLAVTLAAAGALVVVAAAPALASAPPNDDISNATAITSLPFNDVVPDMTLATFDPATDQSLCGGQQQSVWYQFTPASDEKVAFDPSLSSDFVAVDVFTGSPGALTFVGCGQGGLEGFAGAGFALNAIGGTTYWIMVSSACCIFEGSLNLWVYLDVPPQATISVNSPGAVDLGGNATISGTLDCAGTVPAGVSVSGTVRQSVGRLNSVTGSFATTVACGKGVTWTALAQPTAGKFTGGAATVNVAASACNVAGCTQPSTTAVIKLKG